MFFFGANAGIGGEMTVKSLDAYRTHRRSLKGARILVVDDEATVRTIIQQFLENAGFTVSVATSGEEALHCLDNDQFDLMLLDIVMPEMEGVEVLKAVRQKYSKSQLLIIMVTVKEDSADMLKTFSLGANDYIIKPVDFTVLRARIEMHLSHQRAENELREARDALEQRVEERTTELLATNKALVSEITERKQIEGNLRETEGKVSLVLNSAGEGIYGLDLDGSTTFINPTGAKMTGWEANELIGKSQHAILHHTRPDGSPYPREECPIYAAFKDGKVHHVNDEVFWRKDGSNFPVEYTSTPIREDEKLVGAVVIFKDITKRKEAEEALRESHNFLNAIIEGAPDFIFAKDLDGRHTMVNNAHAKALGKSVKDILGKTNVDLFPSDIARCFDLEDREVLTSGKTHSYENPMGIDGSTRTLLTTKYLHFDSEDNPAGVLAISHDITERKRAEEQIKHLANHDELTGLPTLRLGKDRLSSVIALARRNKTSAAVLYLDLDGFKKVNDSLGHKAGDQVLIEVAKRLTQGVRETDTVVRLGGDEFNIVLAQATEETNYVKVAEKIIKTLIRPIKIDDQEVNISASIGIALYPKHGETPEALINKADKAMYVVKRKGKNNYAMANDDL
jgi:diguanylate cyclase (GGDEF)-like protein/PAS domain S-box-containing protein